MKRPILVVDDEPSVARCLRSVLEEAGFAVDEARSAEQAMSRLATSDYDLLLTDLHMPGCPGDQLAKQARSLHPNLRVLLVSADARALATRSGSAHRVLAKPFTVDDLMDAVGALVQRPARRRSSQALIG